MPSQNNTPSVRVHYLEPYNETACRTLLPVDHEKAWTRDADKVTCSDCQEAMAIFVEIVLDKACTHPRASSHYYTCPDCGEDTFPGQ